MTPEFLAHLASTMFAVSAVMTQNEQAFTGMCQAIVCPQSVHEFTTLVERLAVVARQASNDLLDLSLQQ